MLEQLEKLADIWCGATGLSRARLATIVVNRGSFFDRIAAGAGCNVQTVEQFLSHFRDGANWPNGHIPHDAAAVLSNFANIATAESQRDNSAPAAASPGKNDEISRCPLCERAVPNETDACAAIGCPHHAELAA